MTQYTAIIVKEGKWYAGSVKELSGVHSQGRTKEEVLENLKEAIQLILEENSKHLAEESENYIEEKIFV